MQIKKTLKFLEMFLNLVGENVTEEIIIQLDENLIPNKKIILQPDDIVTVNTFLI